MSFKQIGGKTKSRCEKHLFLVVQYHCDVSATSMRCLGDVSATPVRHQCSATPVQCDASETPVRQQSDVN
jgi:hypothetical protein